MAKGKRRSRRKRPTAIQELLAFVEQLGTSPLEEKDERRLFELDVTAGQECAERGITIPEFGGRQHTPVMKLGYCRESVYKYPGALIGQPRIPKGEVECYRICLSPQPDWLGWLRATATTVTSANPSQTRSPREVREANVRKLEDALIDHLLAARDQAIQTRDEEGAPQLLPRPKQEFLARQIGCSVSTVSRALSDSRSRSLKALWQAADDLDAVMGFKPPPGRRRG